MASVSLTAVTKNFGAVQVLRGVDLQIRDGEFMVFVGPSGCGKSTLLRTIAGLEDITSGDMYIGAERVNDKSPSERGIAMVFQSYALYPHMNLYDNMAFGLKLAHVPKQQTDELVRNAARILNIEHLLERKPKDLSGGQRQRVAIGRAIVRKPEVFLFDEPLSNLDTALRVRMRYEFAKLHEEFKTTMVYVTHDQVEAMTLADRIVVLNAGRIEQVGAPLELYEHPVNLFVAGFIGSPAMNFLQGQIEQANAQGALVRLASGESIHCLVHASQARVGDSVTLGLRPEHMRLGASDNALSANSLSPNSPSANSFTAKVVFIESLGSMTYAYCSNSSASEVMTVVLDGSQRIHSGDSVQLVVAPERSYLFDEQGIAFKRLSAPALAGQV